MKKKILVLDDDPGITEVIQIIIEEQGHQFLLLENKNRIERAVAKLQPDLILLDIWISGWDGRDIFKKLRTYPATKKIPIVIISAKNDGKKIAQLLRADDFISKPFDIHEFTERIESHL